MRKFLILSAATAALATPALAEDKDTIDHVIEKGIVLSVQGMDIPVTYNADGTYNADAMGMQIPGTWRRDGMTMCTESSMQPGENCSEYPEGKGPGDSFEMSGAMGVSTVTINE
ncbi:MAG: hypothetical protein CMK09_03380 [Ponticaulis sp.]|nr:hypothetical protein [Ponticaulis sp.]|tara:strand:- start:12783 stop:13124 length:342 start_codon:yes stop_codon:yes gene_type:complete